MEETLDHDLDAILGELNALENNFGDGDPDISRDSDTSSKASKASSTISSSSTVVQVVRPSTAAVPSKISPFGAIHEKTGVPTIEKPTMPSVQGMSIPSEIHILSFEVNPSSCNRVKYIPSLKTNFSRFLSKLIIGLLKNTCF